MIILLDSQYPVYIIYIDVISIALPNGVTTPETLLLKYDYIPTNGKNKQITNDLKLRPFQLMFDINLNDRLSFSLLRPQITCKWEIKNVNIDIYYVENLVPAN